VIMRRSKAYEATAVQLYDCPHMGCRMRRGFACSRSSWWWGARTMRHPHRERVQLLLIGYPRAGRR